MNNQQRKKANKHATSADRRKGGEDKMKFLIRGRFAEEAASLFRGPRHIRKMKTKRKVEHRRESAAWRWESRGDDPIRPVWTGGQESKAEDGVWKERRRWWGCPRKRWKQERRQRKKAGGGKHNPSRLLCSGSQTTPSPLQCLSLNSQSLSLSLHHSVVPPFCYYLECFLYSSLFDQFVLCFFQKSHFLFSRLPPLCFQGDVCSYQ